MKMSLHSFLLLNADETPRTKLRNNSVRHDFIQDIFGRLAGDVFRCCRLLFLCIETLHHLAIYDEGNGGNEGDGSEVVPDVVCVGTCCCPFCL